MEKIYDKQTECVKWNDKVWMAQPFYWVVQNQNEIHFPFKPINIIVEDYIIKMNWLTINDMHLTF